MSNRTADQGVSDAKLDHLIRIYEASAERLQRMMCTYVFDDTNIEFLTLRTLREFKRMRAAAEPRATRVGMQEAFENWCPYKGSPDPHVVWEAAWNAALASGETGASLVKGAYGGECNRTACTTKPATWWSEVEHAHYCQPCAFHINQYLPPNVKRLERVSVSTDKGAATPTCEHLWVISNFEKPHCLWCHAAQDTQNTAGAL